MKLLKYLALILFWLGTPFNVMAESVGCDDVFVDLATEQLVINVAPNNSNDTVNIQCALDAAVSKGVPTVRLKAEKYFIGGLMIENFKGTLEGITKTATVIEVLDDSIECTAMEDSGLLSSVIKFVKGEPRVRFMTIKAESSCIDGDGPDAILHFTGEATGSDNCDNDVIFGAVDRVILDGTGFDFGPFTAVEVAPEGRLLGGCKNTLLGTFKLNRSTLKNIRAGIVTGMKAGAQVDINFNEFRDNAQAINLFDTNQNTTITTNKFFGDNTILGDYIGVYANNYTTTPPSKSRMVIHNNEFNIASTFTQRFSYAIFVGFDVYGSTATISDISSIVTNNKFNLNGINVYGIRFRDISNAHASANRFVGLGRRAIYIDGKTPMTGWTITANTGLATFTTFNPQDIRIGTKTSLFIVGPGQGASIRDDGIGNIVLPQ